MPDSLLLHDFKGFQSLPFSIYPIRSVELMADVLRLRQAAYSRHDYKSELKNVMPLPDQQDLCGYSCTLAAVAKEDGRLLGTVRMTSNVDGPVPLPQGLEDAECLKGAYAYIDRFAVVQGAYSPLVPPALIKAMWLWALGRDARWLVALARAPLARRYKRWGGLTLRGSAEGIVMPDYHDEPYFLVGAPLGEAAMRMARDNPGFGIDFTAYVHPDIKVHGAGLPWADYLAVAEAHNRETAHA